MSDKKHASKKALLKLITEGTQTGESKLELHHRLSSAYYDSDLIAKLIAAFPNKDLKEKYKGLNNSLFILLLITAILKVLSALPILLDNPRFGIIFFFLLPIFNIWFAIEVKKTRGYIYRILGILAIAGIFRSIAQLNEQGAFALIEIGLLILISALSFFLGIKMFPNYGLSGPKIDNSGNWVL